MKYREENGAFTGRRQLLKVPKLGPKAFQQSAGFLRVPESKSVLDNTGVHPESYAAAEGLLALCGYTLADVSAGRLADLPDKIKALGEESVARQLDIGVPTLRDVAAELAKPGRDVRDELPAPILRTDVLDIKDLAPGMVLTGTVRNVVDFGVFVDIGVHQDAASNYPSYDQNLFATQYSQYSSDPGLPLLNRALQGLYTPGSTFKPAVAVAALDSGVINRFSTVYCNGVYTYYDDYRPKCTRHGHSGNIDVITLDLRRFTDLTSSAV